MSCECLAPDNRACLPKICVTEPCQQVCLTPCCPPPCPPVCIIRLPPPPPLCGNPILDMDCTVNSVKTDVVVNKCTTSFYRTGSLLTSGRYYARRFTFRADTAGLYKVRITANEFAPCVTVVRSTSERWQVIGTDLDMTIAADQTGPLTLEVSTKLPYTEGSFTVTIICGDCAVPFSVLGTLSPSSEHSFREMEHGGSPFWAMQHTVDFKKTGCAVEIAFGDPDGSGSLDTFLYLLLKGTATGGSNTTIIDTARTWTVDSLTGMFVYITSGPNAGGFAAIASNTLTTLTFSDIGFAVVPGDKFTIIVATDDDLGPGSNSLINVTIPTTDSYVIEGTTYSSGDVGDVKITVSFLVVSFTYSPAPAYVGDEITFTDLTCPGATSWLWDFGDGHTSSLQNPKHTYSAPGALGSCGNFIAVSLTAACGGDSDVDNSSVNMRHARRLRVVAYDASLFDVSGCTSVPLGGTEWDGNLPNVIGDCRWNSNAFTSFNGLKLVSSVVFIWKTAGVWRLQISGWLVDGVVAGPIWFGSLNANSPIGVYTQTSGCSVGPASVTVEAY